MHTGQIRHLSLQNSTGGVHPRAYGADTKLPKKISEAAEQLLPPQNSMTESVCIIFLECILRMTLFGHFLLFSQKRDAGGTSFSFCFLIMTFFFACTLPGFCTLPMSGLSLCSNTIPCVRCSRIIGRMDIFLRVCLLHAS